MDTGQIKQHMEVVGNDGEHVGMVDHIEGDHIKLFHHDFAAIRQRHCLPLAFSVRVTEPVALPATAANAQGQWHTES